MANGLVVDDSRIIFEDDPEELKWQAEMLQAKQKAELYNEDPEDQLEEDGETEDG